MKNVLKLEELAMFVFCIYALYLFKAEWWYYIILLIGPDISMLGYLLGNKPGALLYNIFHHKGIALSVCIVGLLINNEIIQMAGIILFGHSSMDRFFGYGLKLAEGFKSTHLGVIGKS